MNILIAEDDPSIRQLLSMLVRKAGHTVETAADGASALSLLRGSEYDVMLLDLMMPQMGGFTVVDELRSTAPHLLRRCIVVTATGPREHEFLRNDVFRVIRKPFDVDELWRTIEECGAAGRLDSGGRVDGGT